MSTQFMLLICCICMKTVPELSPMATVIVIVLCVDFGFSHFSGEGHYNLLYNIRGVGLKNVYIVLRRLGGWSKKYDFFVL